MGFNIKPMIERYGIQELKRGYGIVDRITGELLLRKRTNRIERYHAKQWAEQRCQQMNQQKD